MNVDPVKPLGWPWPSDRHESAYRQWEQLYRQRAAAHATCALTGSLGAADVHPDIAPIVALHDEATGCAAGSALA